MENKISDYITAHATCLMTNEMKKVKLLISFYRDQYACSTKETFIRYFLDNYFPDIHHPLLLSVYRDTDFVVILKQKLKNYYNILKICIL